MRRQPDRTRVDEGPPVASRGRPSSPSEPFGISVVICSFTEARWLLLSRAVESALTQSQPPEQVIVVVDHDPALLERARTAFGRVEVIASDESPGLSGARNAGVWRSTGEVVAFLDDDAEADPDWLVGMRHAFGQPHVVGVGGFVEPDWTGTAPSWLPREFHWVVGCSYQGLPVTVQPIRNPIGANMAFRRRAIERAGGFNAALGRIGSVPLGCEETELAIRVCRRTPGAVVLHVPEARVRHTVPAERTTWGYYRSRCWSEGLSKAAVTRDVGMGAGLQSERRYVVRTLRQGVLRGVRDACRGDGTGLLRAGAIVAGLIITTVGYARGRLATASRGSRHDAFR
jgi:GT2 family glycosyltransferase